MARGAFLLRKRMVALTFPPLAKGGSGGVGRTTSASSVCSPLAPNGGSETTPYKGWRGRARATNLIVRSPSSLPVHSTLTGPPPLAPPSQGGERGGHARKIGATISEGLPVRCNPNFV